VATLSPSLRKSIDRFEYFFLSWTPVHADESAPFFGIAVCFKSVPFLAGFSPLLGFFPGLSGSFGKDDFEVVLPDDHFRSPFPL